jgi:hypothetical protein
METSSSPVAKFDPAHASNLLASRCRHEFQSNRSLYDFLANPFQPASVKGRAKTEATQCLHKLLSPLFRSEIVPSHHAVDRSEPFALGIEMIVRYLIDHRRWTNEHATRMVLQSLMPIYLASAQNKIGSSVSESMTYLRETIAVTVLDKVLECDLSQWLIHEVDPTGARAWDPSYLPVRQAFSIDIIELASSVWTSQSSGDSAANGSPISLQSGALNATRRQSHWQITMQWLSGTPQMTIPAELNIDRIAWQSLREHFSNFMQTILVNGQPVSGRTEAVQIESTQERMIGVLETVDQALQDELIGESHTEAGSTKRRGAAVIQEDEAQATNQDVADPEYVEDHRVVEIRSSSDPNLVKALEHQLDECRSNQGSLALLVVRQIHRDAAKHRPKGCLELWQQSLVNHIRDNTEAGDIRGFMSPEDDLAMLVEDMDRPEVTAVVREALQKASIAHQVFNELAAESTIPLIAGIAFVASPARSFHLKQLIDAAWKCLDAAGNQGAGSVKSIECY